jgi:HK97 family phage major capsid protein
MPATQQPNLQDLREKRDALSGQVAEIKKVYEARKAEGKRGDERWGDREDRKRVDALKSQIADFDAQIKDVEDESRFVEIDREERSDPTPTRYKNGINHEREAFEQRSADARYALREWASAGQVSDKRSREACQRLGFEPSNANLACEFRDVHAYRQMRSAFAAGRHEELIEKRALSALNPTAGGFTIGSTLMDRIELNMLFYGEIEQIATLYLTDTGEQMSLATMDDATNEGEMLGESQQTASNEDPTTGLVRWNAYEFSSKIVKVPRSALTDSANLETSLGVSLGMRVARSFNRKCTVGTGGTQPRGYLTAASIGKTTSSATAVTRAEVLDLLHSIDVAYRGPQCRLVMNDLILAELRKLLDNQNRPLDLVTYDNDGAPRWRDGNYRIALNNHMDSTLATTNKTIAFGDFSKGIIRRVRGVLIQRFVERFGDYNQIGFLTIVRQDYNVIDAGTDPIKYLKQA